MNTAQRSVEGGGAETLSEILLDVRNLRTCFHTSDGMVAAVDGVTFHIDKGESVGMVGESGCGKSVTSLSIMRLVPTPPGRIERGEVIFEAEDLLRKPLRLMRRIRGNRISMVFQEPMTSLNPVFSVGIQISEVFRLHQGMTQREAMDHSIQALRAVGIPSPERRVFEYPHQMSGGMRQRVMIAMALACNPGLLIADEPTTALDVTIQAQILELMKDLKKRLDMAILVITHDLGVIAEMAERVLVMYAGKIVEEATTRDLLRDPRHPYTMGLLASRPRLEGKRKRLHVIRGTVPNPREFPTGCRFHPRCEYAMDACTCQEPPLQVTGDGRRVSCWRAGGRIGEAVL
jgi:oligopeptide/dipeptide ABC transporter ATP-binding protein